jgi:hypothetical protein
MAESASRERASAVETGTVQPAPSKRGIGDLIRLSRARRRGLIMRGGVNAGIGSDTTPTRSARGEQRGVLSGPRHQ